MAHYFYPSKVMNEDLHPAYMQFAFHDRKSPTSSPPSDIVHLYMPERANQPSTVDWENEKFGFVGNAMANMGSSALNADWNSQSVINGAVGTGVDAAKLAGARGASMIMAGIANKLGGNVSAESLMGATSGAIPNPYLTAVFRGVNFRNFGYTFKFFPFTESDSDRISDIIKVFRGASLPPGSAGTPFMKYPQECQITYMWRGNENKYLHKFKRAVITGLDVDYTPNNMFSVMRNGMPASVEMNIKFSEIELVFRKDVLEDGF